MEETLVYSLITGRDDSDFCRRISGLIRGGYHLYGSPSVTFNGTDVIAAQAVVCSDSKTKITGERNDS